MQFFGVFIICTAVITHVSHKVFITDILFFAFSKSFRKVNSKEMLTLWILEEKKMKTLWMCQKKFHNTEVLKI